MEYELYGSCNSDNYGYKKLFSITLIYSLLCQVGVTFDGLYFFDWQMLVWLLSVLLNGGHGGAMAGLRKNATE